MGNSITIYPAEALRKANNQGKNTWSHITKEIIRL
jgi:hypothetical protein